MPSPDNRDAEAEWARMQGLGGALRKKRFVATGAGMAVLGVGFLASVLVFFFWPADRIPVYVLSAPIAVMLGPAWALRSKLWPKGQFR